AAVRRQRRRRFGQRRPVGEPGRRSPLHVAGAAAARGDGRRRDRRRPARPRGGDGPSGRPHGLGGGVPRRGRQAPGTGRAAAGGAVQGGAGLVGWFERPELPYLGLGLAALAVVVLAAVAYVRRGGQI